MTHLHVLLEHFVSDLFWINPETLVLIVPDRLWSTVLCNYLVYKYTFCRSLTSRRMSLTGITISWWIVRDVIDQHRWWNMHAWKASIGWELCAAYARAHFSVVYRLIWRLIRLSLVQSIYVPVTMFIKKICHVKRFRFVSQGKCPMLG